METIFITGSHVQIGQGRTEYGVLWVGERNGRMVADLSPLYNDTAKRRYGVALDRLCLVY